MDLLPIFQSIEESGIGRAVRESVWAFAVIESIHLIALTTMGGAALLDRYPREVVIVGVVPASVDLAFERTPAVAAALPALVTRVVAELADHGFAPVARGPTRAERRRDDAARALGL